MKVTQFLKEQGTDALKEQYSIIVKEYPEEGLLVLNYNQIDSPKISDIVMECRGLILDYDFNVVSRSFDRFFNYGEADTDKVFGDDLHGFTVHQKVDGSLIKLYYHDGAWHFATRGTAFAESSCNGFCTFRELIDRAIFGDSPPAFFDDHCTPIFQRWATSDHANLDPDVTYIFEFTSMENRVVTRYDGYTLHYLASRHKNGDYQKPPETLLSALGVSMPESYSFDSVAHCLEAVRDLPNMEEGYVVYRDGVPVCKIKSPAYVAIHHIRGEGLTPKRIMQLVLLNEVDEYLTYFPEDKKFFDEYVVSHESLLIEMDRIYMDICHISDQKEFALKVQESCSVKKMEGILFRARAASVGPREVFHGAAQKSTNNGDVLKLNLLEQYHNHRVAA